MSRRTCYWRRALRELGADASEMTQRILARVAMWPAKAARIAATLHRRRA